MSQDVQDTLIQGLISLAIFLLGFAALRGTIRNIIRKRWGDFALQALVFILLLVSYAFFAVPELSRYSLVGTTVATITVIALSGLVQQSAASGTTVDEWFGSEGEAILSYIPKNALLNRLALRRVASILRSRGTVLTTNLRQSMELRASRDRDDIWLFDVTEEYTYDVRDGIIATLVWEINPDWRPDPPFTLSQPALPLVYSSGEDKWHNSYAPIIYVRDMPYWDRIIDEVIVEGTVRMGRDQFRKINFTREVVTVEEVVGSQQLRTKHLHFAATIQLRSGTPSVTIITKGLPHPISVPSMYLYAWDLVKGNWDFEVTLDNELSARMQVTSLIPITSIGDVNIPILQNRGNIANFRMEALADSVIVPQDAVMVTFEPNRSTSNSDRRGHIGLTHQEDGRIS